jgi:pimeloyl-ACP methyl ester carboxylesterase
MQVLTKFSNYRAAIHGCMAAMILLAASLTAQEIQKRTADLDGLKIHYLTAGSGPAVLLLHGYTQTSRMWEPLIPKLAGKFTVIAPDLPGIGDSEVPNDGLDMKTAAVRIHALVKSLGITKARVVGHDIGLMVAYAYAAQFPSEVEKLVVMDAFLPGVPGWELAYDSPDFWHFRFHGQTPEALVEGREKIYFAYFWNDLAADKTRSLSESDRAAYVAAYSRPGRMRAGWAYFGEQSPWDINGCQASPVPELRRKVGRHSLCADSKAAYVLKRFLDSRNIANARLEVDLIWNRALV